MAIAQDIARNLIMLVNSLPVMESLEEYIDWRISQIQKTLAQTSDFNEILRNQGSLRELERFKTLRDEVLADSE